LRRGLLIAGVSLGVVTLSVGLVVSGIPSVPSSSPLPNLLTVGASPVAAKASGLTHSTTVTTLIIAFKNHQADPAAAAAKAAGKPAAVIAGATVASSQKLRSDTATVTFNKSLTRSQATQISAAAAKTAGVRYVDPAITFYPTSTGGAGYQWNLSETHGIDATDAWAKTTGLGVVVGVIDTGIASNSLLPTTTATTVTSVNGSRVIGTTAALVPVTVTNVGGTQICSTLSAANGSFTCSPFSHKVSDHDQLTVLATDAVGHTSAVEIKVGDATCAPPEVKPTNGHSISGTAEAGATVTITYTADDGTAQTTTATADAATGVWNTNLNPSAKNSSEITVTATDLAGNTSEETTVKADHTAPAPPVVEPTNGRTISGTAEAGAAITITFTQSGQDRTITIPTADTTNCNDTTCHWSIALDPEAANGTAISVAATDAAGNTSSPARTTVDSVAPAPPAVEHTQGIELSGTAEAGARITVSYTADDGSHTATTTAAQTTPGAWKLTLDPAAVDGTDISVTSTDAAGNTSDTATIPADHTAPDAPVVNPTDGSRLSGSAEPGSSLAISYDHTKLGLTVGANGLWTIAGLSPRLADGTHISVTATDASGNVSLVTMVTVDSTQPAAPAVNPTNGSSVSGSAEANTVLSIRFTTADVLHTVTTTANGQGSWSITLDPAVADGTEISVTATDAAKNTSEATTVIVDAQAPKAPQVDATNGTHLSGTTEGDAKLTISYANHTLTTTANDQGLWSITLDPAAANNSQISVTASDAAGNTSEATTVTADSVAPQTPTVNADADGNTDGASLSGTAEAGASLTISYSDKTATTAAGADGAWSITLDPAAEAGTVISVTATDAVGNVSETCQITVAADPDPEQVSGASTHADSTPAVAPASTTTGTNLVGTVLPGYDFIDADTNPTDPNANYAYHGTHVAGIVAAAGTSPGVLSGVAPGTQILPIRALDKYSGDLIDIADAITWGSGGTGYLNPQHAPTSGNPYPADVLNLSLGARGSACPQTLQNAIDGAVSRGTVVVVSAGNDNESIANNTPANCKNVIVATATDYNGKRAAYSNWGTATTSGAWLVAAPGGSGLAADCTAVQGACGIASTTASGLELKFGTSMAAPHVTAVAAMLKSLNKNLGAADIAKIITGTATPLTDGCATGVCGSGIVNAAAAVAKTNPQEVAAHNASYPQLSITSFPFNRTVGQVLSVSITSGYPAVTYQWYRGSTAISGATNPWYQTIASDFGTTIWARVITSGGGPQVDSPLITISGRASLSMMGKPTIRGTVKVGKKLTANATYAPSTVAVTKTYQWYRNGKKISKATSLTYKLTKKDRKKKITVKVTLTAYGYYVVTGTSSKTKSVKK
jgi:hypothetical protein